MLERLATETAMPVNMLDIQYRMPPQIAAWPSVFFYKSQLQSFKSEPTRRQLPRGFSWPHDAPLAFINVCSQETWMNPGYTNLGEVEVICATVTRMLNAGTSPSCIGVISPYAAQTRLFERRLLREITVGNVDSFQGREKEIIFVSFVRSNSVNAAGFMSDGRRLNVAVTRASVALILVGNVGFLTMATEEFQDLIGHCHEVDCIVGEPIQQLDYTVQPRKETVLWGVGWQATPLPSLSSCN